MEDQSNAVDLSKEKPIRKLEEVQNEYKHFCAVLGDKDYKAEILKVEIGQIRQRLLELNQESQKIIKAKSDEAPAGEANA